MLIIAVISQIIILTLIKKNNLENKNSNLNKDEKKKKI